MDRWSNEDSFERGPRGPAGTVARLGIGGFRAASSAEPDLSEAAPKIEVVASRREQRREQAYGSAPEPRPSIPRSSPHGLLPAVRPAAPAFDHAKAAAGPAHPPPPWSAQPPGGWALSICKEGEVVQRIPLNSASCLFGRDAGADVIVDHASCSRKHAQLGYREASRSWGAVDLGSTHGTFVDGVRLKPGAAKEMMPDSQLRLGASTRFYTVHPPARLGSKRHLPDSEAGSGRQKSVRFGDSGGLEQIIGYSDGRSFAVNVGPVANDGTLEGQFSNAVEAPDLDARVKSKTGAQLDGIARAPAVARTLVPRPEARPPRKPQPLVKPRDTGLYGDLPDAGGQ